MKTEKEIKDKIFEIKKELTDTLCTEYATLSNAVIINYLMNRAMLYVYLRIFEWVLEDNEG